MAKDLVKLFVDESRDDDMLAVSECEKARSAVDDYDPARTAPRAGPAVLEEPALVLNSAWVPIDTTTVRHALSLVVNEAARVVEPESYRLHDFVSWIDVPIDDDAPHVRTVALAVRAPEIIVLVRYDRVPAKHVPFTRRNLYRRDRFRCQYCRKRFPMHDLTIDHVVPRSRGGPSTWENCVVACLDCNVRKGDRVPNVAGMPLERPPRRPQWSPCLDIRTQNRKPSWERFVGPKYWSLDIDS